MVAIRKAMIPVVNPNRPSTKIAPGPHPYITIHETANPDAGADAEMHRVFTHNGGGPENVSFHFVVDDHEAIQLLPLDTIGWHAGDGCDDYPDGVGQDDIGCFASVAIETCVNRDGDWDKTIKNLEDLCVLIITGSKDIDYGDGRTKGRFSPQRLAQHNAWSGKECPRRIRNTDLWPTLVKDISERVNVPVTVYTDPIPVPKFDGKDKKLGKFWFHALNRDVEVEAETVQRAWGSEDAPKANKNIKAGRFFVSHYIVEGASGQWWYVTKDGYRILMSKCKEKFRPFRFKP